MRICFKIGGHKHCYDIPILLFPVKTFVPGPGPVNYPALLHDISVVASLQEAAKTVSDQRVREGLEGGIRAALEAAQSRGGEHVTILQGENIAAKGA
jgi:hypothetical protein